MALVIAGKELEGSDPGKGTYEVAPVVLKKSLGILSETPESGMPGSRR